MCLSAPGSEIHNSVTGPHTETYIHFEKKRNKREFVLNSTVIMAEGKFKPGIAFRRFTLNFLQKFEQEQLLAFSCMTGIRYFLTKGLTPVTVEGRHL
jgi:hypothetical protein